MKLSIAPIALLAAATAVPFVGASGNNNNGKYLRALKKNTNIVGDLVSSPIVPKNNKPSSGASSGWLRSLESKPPTIAELAVGTEDLSILVSVLPDDLVEALSGDTELTVFAPTNEAFEELSAGLGLTLEEIAALPNLRDILTYHVVAGTALSTSLTDGLMVPTLEGKSVEVGIRGGEVEINKAEVIMADVLASNGVVHVIDAVLIPPDDDEEEDSEVSANEEMDSEDIDAMEEDEEMEEDEDMDEEEEEEEDEEEEEEEDDEEDDEEDEESESMAATDTATATEPTLNIVEVALEAAESSTEPEFTTLVKILASDDFLAEFRLIEVLSGEGPFTVFAPTDEAFATLFEEVDPTTLSKETLLEIVTYHVVPNAALYAADLGEEFEGSALTVAEKSLDILKDGSSVEINDAQVIIADIAATNGVIHAIDKVLMPPVDTEAEESDEMEEDEEEEEDDEAEEEDDEEEEDEEEEVEEEEAEEEEEEDMVPEVVFPTAPGNTNTEEVSKASLADCNKSIPTLGDKVNPSSVMDSCVSSCECEEGCCVRWYTGNFCAQPGDTPGTSVFPAMRCLDDFSN